MTADWQMMTIDEIKASSSSSIAIGPFGSRMKSDRYVKGGNGAVPVIRGNNLSETKALKGEYVYVTVETADELRSSNVFPGDLVFPHRGLIGEVGIVPADQHRRYILSTSLMKLTCDTSIADPLFVFYFFRSSLGKHQLMQHASQVGTPGIATPLTSLKSIRLPLPPLPEQLAIAHILGALDDKIELNRQINQTLEQIAAALFTSWFVDFDPVRAKAEGRHPEGMAAETAALFPDRLVASEIGAIPEGWRAEALPVAIEINPARRLRKGDEAPYLDMANAPTVGPRVANWVDRPFGSGSRFENGDALLARITPCLENGKTAYVDFLNDGQVGWGSTEFIVLRAKPPLPPVWAYLMARNHSFRRFAIQSMTGSSGRQRVPTDAISKYVVALPSDAIATVFASIVKPLFDSIKVQDEQSRTLAAIRDFLLPRLLSGDISVGSGNEQAASGYQEGSQAAPPEVPQLFDPSD